MGVLKQLLEQLQLLWAAGVSWPPNPGANSSGSDGLRASQSTRPLMAATASASTPALSRLLDTEQPHPSSQNADKPAWDFSQIKTKTLPQARDLRDLPPAYLSCIISQN